MNPVTTVIRFNKNLAHNTYDFERYEQDATLIRNLVVFIAFSYQEDLFGYRTLDPVKFARHMGYKDHRSLYKKVAEPAQLQGLSAAAVEALRQDSEEYVWDDLLNNALYKMAHQPLSLSFGGKIAAGQSYSRIDTMLILNSVSVYFDPKNPQKRYYKYKASKEFITNLSRYFLMLNLGSFTRLRENRLQPLYLYLCNLRETLRLKNTEGTPHFDMICSYAGINDKEPKQRKKKVNKKLTTIQQKAPELHLDWRWDKNGRFYYKLVVWFQGGEQPELSADAFFTRVLVRHLFQEYTKFHPEERETQAQRLKFRAWLENADKDHELKRSVICNVILLHYGTSVDAYDNRVFSILRNLPQVNLPDLVTGTAELTPVELA